MEGEWAPFLAQFLLLRFHLFSSSFPFVVIESREGGERGGEEGP